MNLNWPFLTGAILIGLNLMFIVQSIALVHVCVGYISRPHFILMLGATAAAVSIVHFQSIWIPLVVLFFFFNLVVLAEWLLIRVGWVDLEREDAHKSTPEYCFYFNPEIGYDVKLHKMLAGPGCGIRLFRLQFWVFIVGLQVIAYVIVAKDYIQK